MVKKNLKNPRILILIASVSISFVLDLVIFFKYFFDETVREYVELIFPMFEPMIKNLGLSYIVPSIIEDILLLLGVWLIVSRGRDKYDITFLGSGVKIFFNLITVSASNVVNNLPEAAFYELEGGWNSSPGSYLRLFSNGIAYAQLILTVISFVMAVIIRLGYSPESEE